VGKFLERNGFNVRYQVGSIGYFIDIVIDSQTGKHIIGIECDGAQYHSSKSARDRDKLRQAQLENLGWKIYRVWSTDWFHNRRLAEERLLNAVNAAFQN
jgi:very-short-patch-repair endonuclease